jgi:hypothetical protein
MKRMATGVAILSSLSTPKAIQLNIRRRLGIGCFRIFDLIKRSADLVATQQFMTLSYFIKHCGLRRRSSLLLTHWMIFSLLIFPKTHPLLGATKSFEGPAVSAFVSLMHMLTRNRNKIGLPERRQIFVSVSRQWRAT